MGGFIIEDEKFPVEIAFTGGKANPAWMQLVKPTVVSDTPNQLRSVSSKSITAYNLRRAGFVSKLKKGDSIMYFATKLDVFVKNTGMDTITYRVDPTVMTSVFTEWPRFNIEVVRTSSTAL